MSPTAQLIRALVVVGLATIHANPTIGAEEQDGKSESPIMWTGGMGVSYPLIASLSAGAIVPLTRKEEGAPYGFPGVPAIHANVDVGLGGGMVSGGLSLPLGVGYGTSAISFKAAAIRTWWALSATEPTAEGWPRFLSDRTLARSLALGTSAIVNHQAPGAMTSCTSISALVSDMWPSGLRPGPS